MKKYKLVALYTSRLLTYEKQLAYLKLTPVCKFLFSTSYSQGIAMLFIYDLFFADLVY
jgi:hypothetical protein